MRHLTQIDQHSLTRNQLDIKLNTFVGSHFSEFPDLQIVHSSGYPSHWGLAGLPPSLGIENVAPDTLVRLGEAGLV